MNTENPTINECLEAVYSEGFMKMALQLFPILDDSTDEQIVEWEQQYGDTVHWVVYTSYRTLKAVAAGFGNITTKRLIEQAIKVYAKANSS